MKNVKPPRGSESKEKSTKIPMSIRVQIEIDTGAS